MKDIYELLKFELGSESADYEFDIIPIPPYDFIQNNLSLEPNEYFGKDDILFGMKTKQIILYFNADILMKVKITFRGNKVEIIKEILEKSNCELPKNMMLKLHYDIGIKQTVIEYQKKDLGKL